MPVRTKAAEGLRNLSHFATHGNVSQRLPLVYIYTMEEEINTETITRLEKEAIDLLAIKYKSCPVSEAYKCLTGEDLYRYIEQYTGSPVSNNYEVIQHMKRVGFMPTVSDEPTPTVVFGFDLKE